MKKLTKIEITWDDKRRQWRYGINEDPPAAVCGRFEVDASWGWPEVRKSMERQLRKRYVNAARLRWVERNGWWAGRPV